MSQPKKSSKPSNPSKPSNQPAKSPTNPPAKSSNQIRKKLMGPYRGWAYDRPTTYDLTTHEPLAMTWTDDRPYTQRPKPPRLYEKKKGISPWGERILFIRRVTGWTQRQLAVISGICYFTIGHLESGWLNPYHPTLKTIKKIRLIEAAYANEIKQYKTDPYHFERLTSRRAVWVNCWPQRHRLAHLDPLGPPRDPAYVEALGGLATFSCLESKTKKKQYVRPYRRRVQGDT